MTLKIFKLLLAAILLHSCGNNDKAQSKIDLAPYDSINNLLKNYDIENASNLWRKLDAKITKNPNDSITWVHEQMFVQILLNANYFDSAKTEILKTLSTIDSSKFKDIYTNLKRLQSVSELQLGNYNESINLNFQILPYFEKTNNFKRVCGIKANISWAYFNLMAWSDSKRYILETINLANQNKHEDLLPDYYQRLATVFAGQLQYDTINKYQKFDSAILYYNKSLAYLDTNEASWDLSNLYLNKGSLYTLMQMYDASILEYQKALKVNKEINDEQGIANCYTNLGLTYMNTSQFKEAESVLLMAEETAIKMNDFGLLTTINKNLAVLYNNTKQFEKSSNYYEKYTSVYFKELDKSSIESSKSLSIKYENEKTEKEIQLYKNEQLKNKNRVLGLSLLLVLLLSIVVIVAYVYFQHAKNKKIIDQIHIENEKKILEQITKETERNRISRNLHDNLGAYASSILNKIKMIENDSSSEYKETELEELRLTAQQILSNLKSIVIDLNQKSLPFLEFMDQIKTELMRLLNSYPKIDFNINEQLEFNSIYSPENQFHLKSILFEMINNALKHSQADRINLDISESQDILEISISDNGKFSSNIENGNGNGIKNIKSRIQFLKGHLNITKNEEGGTRISIQLNKVDIV